MISFFQRSSALEQICFLNSTSVAAAIWKRPLDLTQ
jgi:hypothetical protein